MTKARCLAESIAAGKDAICGAGSRDLKLWDFGESQRGSF